MKKNYASVMRKCFFVMLAIVCSFTQLSAQCGQQLVNGGFETRTFSPWVIGANAPVAPVIDSGVAHSGSYSAFIGSPVGIGTNNGGTASIYQQVHISAEAGTLSFWYLPISNVLEDGWQMAEITDSLGNVLSTIMQVNSNSGVWTNVVYDISAYAGQTVRIQFRVTSYVVNTFSFGMNVDDVTLTNKRIYSQSIPFCSLSSIHATVGNTVHAAPGIYMDTLAGGTIAGCDSVVTTTILYQPIIYRQSPVFCSINTMHITVNNHVYTAPGTYVDTLADASIAGCDSIVITTIQYQPEVFSQAITFCGSGSITVGTHTYSSPGFHIDSLFNGTSVGCDSVVITNLNVEPIPPTPAAISNQTVCNGDSTAAVYFNIPDTTLYYQWSSSNPSIGLHVYGTGTIPAFTAVNNSNTAIIDTIIVSARARGYAYVTSGNAVIKINIATHLAVDTIYIPNAALQTVFSPDGSLAYIYCFPNADGHDALFNIYAINLGTNSIVRTYTAKTNVEWGLSSGMMCISPDGSRLFFTDGQNSHLVTVDIASGVYNNYIMPDSIDNLAYGICISPDGSKVYIGAGDSLVIFNTVSDTFLARVPMPANTLAEVLALTPDGTKLYAGAADGGNYGNANVVAINTATNTIIDSLPVSRLALGDAAICFNPGATQLYVLSWDVNISGGADPLLRIFSTANDSLLDSVALNQFYGEGYGVTNANEHGDVAVTPDGRDLYHVCHFITDTTTGIFRYNDTSLTTLFASLGQGTQGIAGRNYLINNSWGTMGDIMAPGHCISTASTFTITVYPTARHTQSYSLCPGGSITVGNKVHNITGIYIDTLVNASVHGCDSIVTTNLIVKSYPTFYQAISFCGAGSVTIGNALHNTAGYYIDTLYNAGANGCDSIVYTNLSIGTVPAAAPTETSSAVCPGTTIPSNELGPAGSGIGYLWTGSTTSIGLADGGQYTVPSFASANTSSSTIIDTIIVRLTAGGYAYVVNTNFASVSVIDRQSALVVGTISVGNSPEGIAISPDGSLAYVTNSGDNTVSVISTASQSVVTLIHVGNNPQGICVSPDGSRVYVANYSGANVFVINTGTNTVVDTIAVGNNPLGISATPDGKQVYIANYGDNTVSVISTAGNNVSALIHVGANPYGVSVSPPGNLTYVTNLTSGTVSVISTVNNVVTDTVIVGSGPKGIAVSPDGSRVYVANSVSDNVSVIYAHNDSVSNPIGVGTRPNGISVSADGTRAYVANALSGSMSVINTTANTVSNNITGLPGPNSFGNFVTGSGCTGPTSSYTITVYPTTHTQNYSFCVTGSVTVGAHTYTSTGTYIDTLANTTVHGCDSIVITNLNIHPVANSVQSLAICGGSITIGTHTYDTTGTYIDTLTGASMYGCDSIVLTHLTVFRVAAYTQSPVFCQGGSITVGAHTYTATGNYTDTLTGVAVNGCDSIVTTHLTVNALTGINTQPVSQLTCSGANVSFNVAATGANLSYQWVKGNGALPGADSVSYSIPTVSIGDTGSYTVIVTGLCGVDTSHAATLAVTASLVISQQPVPQALCAGSPVTFSVVANGPNAAFQWQKDGSNISGATSSTYALNSIGAGDAGTYTCNITSSCGNAVTNGATLTVLTPSLYSYNSNICSGSSYLFNGQSLNATGIYYDTLMAANGCDSLVTLHLTVQSSIATALNDTICAGGSYLFKGQSLTNSGTYLDTLTAQGGCDSIITLNLALHSINDTATVNGAVCLANATGVSYQWINCASGQAVGGGTGQQYTATQSGSFQCIVTLGDCSDTTNCVSAVVNGIEEIESYNFNLYPNPNQGSFIVTYNYPGHLQLRITNAIGQLVSIRELSKPGEQLDVTNLAAGIYLVEILDGAQLLKVLKMVKE